MADPQNHNPPPPDPPRVPPKTNTAGTQKAPHGFPNPPESRIPDAATLRDQWKFAIRQYSRWYSQAWGSAILAGLSFFALGWFIKGGNPLPSLSNGGESSDRNNNSTTSTDTPSPPVPPVLSSSPADAIQTPKS